MESGHLEHERKSRTLETDPSLAQGKRVRHPAESKHLLRLTAGDGADDEKRLLADGHWLRQRMVR